MDLNPEQLQNLTPLVAVCVIFAGLLSVLMLAFLKHLDIKDKRTAQLVTATQNVLQGMQIELHRLAENDRSQTEILRRILATTETRRRARLPPDPPAEPERG